MAQTLQRLNPASMPDAGQMGYSQITTVEPGRLAFISGQVAWRADGATPPDSLEEQTRLVCANAKTALEAIGASTQDLAMVRVYMTDLTPERLEAAFPIVVEWFDGAAPSLTGVGVAALAGVGLQIEMEMTVRLPD